MSSMFDIDVRNRQQHTPWAHVNLREFMTEMVFNAPSDPVCPQCKGPVASVDYPSDSPIDRVTWEANRVGKWYCPTCPSNLRSMAVPVLCYWWDHEVRPDPREHATVLSVHERRDVATRQWWSLQWTSADGARAQAEASRLDLCLWRAAEFEMRTRAQLDRAERAAEDREEATTPPTDQLTEIERRWAPEVDGDVTDTDVEWLIAEVKRLRGTTGPATNLSEYYWALGRQMVAQWGSYVGGPPIAADTMAGDIARILYDEVNRGGT